MNNDPNNLLNNNLNQSNNMTGPTPAPQQPQNIVTQPTSADVASGINSINQILGVSPKPVQTTQVQPQPVVSQPDPSPVPQQLMNNQGDNIDRVIGINNNPQPQPQVVPQPQIMQQPTPVQNPQQVIPQPMVQPQNVIPQPVSNGQIPIAQPQNNIGPQPIPGLPSAPPSMPMNNMNQQSYQSNNQMNNSYRPVKSNNMVIIIVVLLLIGVPAGYFILTNMPKGSSDKKLLENADLNGYMCLGSNCSVQEGDFTDDSGKYTLNTSNNELMEVLLDYKEYIKLDVYYTEKGNEKTIVEYKIYIKETGEDITSIKNEAELREKLGLYTLGTHTETLTVKKTKGSGAGFEGDNNFLYIDYIFTDSKQREYEMRYKYKSNPLNLNPGSKYTVTFEVVDGTFGYEYNIKDVK